MIPSSIAMPLMLVDMAALSLMSWKRINMLGELQLTSAILTLPDIQTAMETVIAQQMSFLNSLDHTDQANLQASIQIKNSMCDRTSIRVMECSQATQLL